MLPGEVNEDCAEFSATKSASGCITGIGGNADAERPYIWRQVVLPVAKGERLDTWTILGMRGTASNDAVFSESTDSPTLRRNRQHIKIVVGECEAMLDSARAYVLDPAAGMWDAQVIGATPPESLYT